VFYVLLFKSMVNNGLICPLILMQIIRQKIFSIENLRRVSTHPFSDQVVSEQADCFAGWEKERSEQKSFKN
jgi:hypothetical protein